MFRILLMFVRLVGGWFKNYKEPKLKFGTLTNCSVIKLMISGDFLKQVRFTFTLGGCHHSFSLIIDCLIKNSQTLFIF